MNNTEKDELINKLDNAIKYCDFIFEDKTSSRIKRFLKNPIKLIIRKIDIKILKRRIAIPVKGKTFWGEKINVFSFELGLYLCGFINHDPEVRLTKFFIKNTKEDDIFLDIGSHHGFYSLLINEVSRRKAHIFAFEPSPVHSRILEKNTKKYKNIKVNKFALSSKKGAITFFENKKGVSTMKKESADKQAEKGHLFEKITVETKTLDEYCAEKNISPSLIKIDVEGAELDVLLGAQKIIKEKRPVIAIEIWGDKLSNDTHKKALNLLNELNYKPYKILSDGSIEKLTEINLEKDVDENLQFNNFIFKI